MQNNPSSEKEVVPARRGITLAEVLAVTSILVILGSILFVMSGPSREKAYEASCMSNLKQLYSGNVMYAEETDSGSTYPELHGMAYVPFPSALAMAFPDPKILWCPSVPEVYKKRLGISYNSALWFDPIDSSGSVSDDRARVIQREKEQGSATHIVECTAHDELYYAPNEKDIDNKVANPFRIYLNIDGSVVGHRFSTLRDFPITGTIQ